MKRLFLIVLTLFAVLSIGCVKQKTRYNEPALTPENYESTAVKLYEYYFSKHLGNVLERTDDTSISKEERGRRTNVYSRIIVADLRQQIGSAQTPTEKRNQIICIENYGLRDKTGFNPYDYIMVSKYKYDYAMNQVVYYKVNNGDPNNTQEVDKRIFSTEEINAYIKSVDELNKIVQPLRVTNDPNKFKEFWEDIRKKYVFGTRTEFLIKQSVVTHVFGTEQGQQTATQAATLEQAVAVVEAQVEGGKKIRINLIYIPINIVRKLKVGDVLNNLIVTLDDSVMGKGKLIMGFGNTYEAGNEGLVITTYIRGLEHLLSVTPEENAGTQEGASPRQNGGATENR